VALVVEDGTGLSTAETYSEVADAATWLLKYGKSAFDSLATTALKEESLRAGTLYVDSKYESRMGGSRANSGQALAAPRAAWYYEDDGRLIGGTTVPEEIKRACYEAGELHASGEDLNNAIEDESDVKAVTIGPLKDEFFQGRTKEKRYPAIERHLRRLLQPLGVLVRA